jgi:DNA-directed RNA polymerase alpha subunit
MASRTRCSLDDVSPVYSRAATVDFIRHAKQHLRVQILRESSEDVEFEVIGLDAPITNALRRILLAEVPSIAIESVYVHNNTSIVQDEVGVASILFLEFHSRASVLSQVLSHRMGLVPLRVS